MLHIADGRVPDVKHAATNSADLELIGLCDWRACYRRSVRPFVSPVTCRECRNVSVENRCHYANREDDNTCVTDRLPANADHAGLVTYIRPRRLNIEGVGMTSYRRCKP